MPRKVLFDECPITGRLDSAAKAAVTILGAIYEDEYDREYRFIKNVGATALVRSGCALMKLGQTSALNTIKYVLPSDATVGDVTAQVTMPAGSPVTAIAASGGSAYGWVQVRGPKKVTLRPAATAAQQQPGCVSIAANDAAQAWQKPATSVVASVVGGANNFRCAEILATVGATGVTAPTSALVYLRCL